MMTRNHIMGWNRLPQVEIAAICARHLTNARKRADHLDSKRLSFRFGAPAVSGRIKTGGGCLLACRTAVRVKRRNGIGSFPTCNIRYLVYFLLN
jgi:hypothetical protein